MTGRENDIHLQALTPSVEDDESGLFDSVTLGTAQDTTTSQRLPLGPNFVIQLQVGEYWDSRFLGVIVYADFQKFEDLLKYVLGAANIKSSSTACCYPPARPQVELRVAYVVSGRAALSFHNDQLDPQKDKDVKMMTEVVSDQKSWDGAVFAAQMACAAGDFYGIQLKVWKKEEKSARSNKDVKGDETDLTEKKVADD